MKVNKLFLEKILGFGPAVNFQKYFEFLGIPKMNMKP